MKNKSIFCFFCIIAVATVAYSNTFHVPFVFDDKSAIVENSELRNIKNFFDLDHLKSTRYIGQLSFALNFLVHGLDVRGYHLVNLIIHIINGLLVYFLVTLTFKTPRLQGSSLKSRAVALFSALLFVAHPVQTQAVTYIVQRYASMTTMFYLASVVSYARWRLSGRLWWHLCSVVMALLAMKTKEIAFTLPLMVFLYELVFFGRPSKKRLLYMVPLFLTMSIIPLSLININRSLGEVIGEISSTTKVQTELSRWAYLCTEFRVMVTYLRLLFFPVNQSLDYDYPVFYGLLEPEVVLSLLLHLSLLALGIYQLRASRTKESALRLAAFGIFWFYLALSVESSVIPIVDVIFEHRLYLPSVGVFMVVSVIFFTLARRLHIGPLKVAGVAVALVLVLAGLTYRRNLVWQDEVTLWSDVLKKHPRKARAYVNVAEAYIISGQIDKSYWYLKRAIELEPSSPFAHVNLGIYYTRVGLYNKAIEHFQTALRYLPDDWKAHMNMGFTYFLMRDIDNAILHLEKAYRRFPYEPKIMLNLGIAYKAKGLYDIGQKYLDMARRLNPQLFKIKR